MNNHQDYLQELSLSEPLSEEASYECLHVRDLEEDDVSFENGKICMTIPKNQAALVIENFPIREYKSVNDFLLHNLLAVVGPEEEILNVAHEYLRIHGLSMQITLVREEKNR